MVIPEKTYTDNPFVDNIIYYAKYIAMNCTVKDEDEALYYESSESLQNGDTLIACVESTSTYETFKYIPEEILEKYINVSSNLDLFVNNPIVLNKHLDQYGVYTKVAIYDKLSQYARAAYCDHYEIMINYIMEIGPTWLDDNEELYNNCINGTATYEDLFDIIPLYTRKRIIKTYLNNYNVNDLNNICNSLEAFNEYISTRTNVQNENELQSISAAMRSVFISHYDTMVERKYLRASADKWLDYNNLIKNLSYSMNVGTTYYELYNIFPRDELYDTLVECVGEEDTLAYGLSESLDNLEEYLNNIAPNEEELKEAITNMMWAKYLVGNNLYLNNEMYLKCKSEEVDYLDLTEYLPKETQKMILNKEIDEITNLKVYTNNKDMLNSYLNSLSEEDRNSIKESINKDMRKWFPENYVEKNNYYRAFVGLPPLDKNGNPYEDTLIHSYNQLTGSYTEFGERFVRLLYSDDDLKKYPRSHWLQNIYEFDSYDIAILNERGILESYIKACGSNINDFRYRYIKYLIDGRLDIYQCRKALKFQLIGLPVIDDEDAKRRFIDRYVLNRDYCIRAIYSDAYKFQSDYYDKFMIIFILVNTIMDMLSDISEMIITREVFDARCIKWLFESFGVPFYSEIPIKYLRAMLKNLNTLLKYKSSTKNMIDICKLFGFSDVKVFGYYLFRERNKDSSGNYIIQENNDISYDLNDLWVKDQNGTVTDFNGETYTKLLNYYKYNEEVYTKEIVYEEDGELKHTRIIKNDADVYIKDPSEEYNDFIPLKDALYFKSIKANTQPATVKFIKVPINESITAYKNDPNYICTYDEIVTADEDDTWDGGRNHEDLYQEFVDYEFNADKSKYISVEAVTDLTEQAFQVSYFYNMLFDNLYSEDALTLSIPYIQKDHTFRFTDIVCYLFALIYFYNNLEDNIMYSPTQILYVKGYNFNEALDAIMTDTSIFSGDKNVFDVNEKISSDNYDYREAFTGYNIKGFNLEADVDALNKEIYEEYGISLDDFIVDNDNNITLQQFFSLNNSYYQRDIFNNNIAPIAYNQNIRSAYGVNIYSKEYAIDFDNRDHCYIINNDYKIEIIDDTSDDIYIIDSSKYLVPAEDLGTIHSVYKKYTRQNNGNYILSSNNAYYYNESSELFELLPDSTIVDATSDNLNIEHLLVLQDDNEYKLFELVDNEYKRISTGNEYYIYNSDQDYILALITDCTYEDTNSMIVVFNQEVTKDTAEDLGLISIYNPEETDNKWDENDWFYEGESNEFGIHGENIWYYRSPDSEEEQEESEEDNTSTVPIIIGSGFYIDSSTYLGEVQLEKDKKYYMSFDIETNFTGKIQIYNTADSSVNSATDKIYNVTERVQLHIAQTFIANNNNPNIMFLIYDFDEYSIEIGDFIIIKNVNIMKAYSDNFISRDIPSYDKLKELYRTNELMYKYIADLMNKESDYDKYNMYKKIYDALMVSRYNKEAFKIESNTYAKTYTDHLKNRDSILYSNLVNFKKMDQETMHREITSEIIEIVNAMEQYIDSSSYNGIYSYFPAVSANYIQQYIINIINWFKSWKVHLLGINTVYRFGNSNDTLVKILERKKYKNRVNNIKQNVYVHGTIKINPYDDVNISGIKYSDIYDFDNTESDTPYTDNISIVDRIRIITITDDTIEYTDPESQTHLIIDQQPITNQLIDEINLNTGDYLDWSGILDE